MTTNSAISKPKARATANTDDATPAPPRPPSPAPPDQISLDPRTVPAAQRPQVLRVTRGDTATRLALTTLEQSARQLLAELRPERAHVDDVLASVEATLGRSRGRFPPGSPERAMCDTLLDWLNQNASASPGTTATSLVLTRFSDPTTFAHGAFKAVSRLLDRAAQSRVTFDVSPAVQVALGFVPGLGQLLDLRNLLAAIDALEEGRDGASHDVAFAGLAFFPGLGCLRAGRTSAGRQALRQAAESLSAVSREGLEVLAKQLGPEAAALLEKKVRVVNVARTELMARIDMSSAGMPQNLRQLADNLSRALRDHLTPDDLVGAMRDVARVGVKKAEGGTFDHFTEVRDAWRSIQKPLDSDELSRIPGHRELEGALHECRKLLEDILGVN